MKLQGNPVSKGIGVGNVQFYRPALPRVEERFVGEEQIAQEREKYHVASQSLAGDLKRLAYSREGDKQLKIFEAHAEILSDPVTKESVFALIDGGICAEWAVHTVFSRFADMMRENKNTMMMERAADFEDLRQKLLYRISGKGEWIPPQLTEPCVLLAEDLLPSQMISLPTEYVMAIVTEQGGSTSHATILARSMGIPMVVGVSGCTSALREGEWVAVDAWEGCLYVEPKEGELKLLKEKQQRWLLERENASVCATAPSETRDGESFSVLLNLGGSVPSPWEVAASDGVGLLRSEFLFLEREEPPSEEEQFIHYRAVLEACCGKPVTLRILDAGSDKTLPYFTFGKKENPALGVRGLRLCFAYPKVFRVQLRAALRASAFGPLRLLFPMVSGLDEWEEARELVEDVKAELKEEGIAFDANLPLGVMIEVPSLALLGEEIARRVDFASVGTNDLCQYINAADRVDPDVSRYYDVYHPALWRLLASLSAAFEAEGKPLSLCGEAVGEPMFLLAAYGLGIRDFSMSSSMIGTAKEKLRAYESGQLRSLAKKLLCLRDGVQIRQLLRTELRV